jgi:gluconate 2-dehydrogenase alpha chain
VAIRKTDIVIVGVGAAGAILAAELAKTGANVIGIERGPRLNNEDFAGRDELRYFQRQDLRPDPVTQPVTWRPNESTHAVRMNEIDYGNQAGGGTVHYGALSWRMHEHDFKPRSTTIARYGEKAIPEDAALIDWPVDWAEIEPFYDQAEYDLGISGTAGNVKGQKLAGGNPFEGARSRAYPLPALQKGQADILFETATEKLGYHPFPSPRAILSRDYKGRIACSNCGFCQAFGCPFGSKSSTLVNKLPEADATGHFSLITNAMVYRVNTDNSGKATGISYYGPDGSENTIEADVVILTTYIYDNVRLLMLSKTDKYPDGLANSNGMLGRGYMAHIGARIFAAYDKRYVNVFMGPSNQKHTIDDFNADNFDHSGLDFIRGAQISVSCAALDAGPIGATQAISPPPGMHNWGAAYRDFLSQYFARYTAITAQTENLPYLDQRIDLDPHMKDKYGLPAPRVTYDWRRPNEVARIHFMQKKLQEVGAAMGADKVWLAPLGQGSPGGHHMGGTRMGSNPKDSVVNKYGQTWDIPNLFVIGSSTFPSMGCGFNPTLTIQALAYLSADAITNKYLKNPGRLI